VELRGGWKFDGRTVDRGQGDGRRDFAKVALGAGAVTAAPTTLELRLPADLQAIFAQSYPGFSDAEYARRHAGVARAMEAVGADHVLIVTAQNVGNATRWMTSWPGTAEALLLFRPGERMVMFVEYYNHLPLAQQISRNTEVRWGEEKGISKTIEELTRRGAKRVGVIGPLSGMRWKALEEKFELVSLDADYVKLRLVKSEEEIAWLRIGAALSDAGMAALVGGTRPGMSEHELGSMIERAFIGHGGTHVIHFIGSTRMAAPDCYVPRQFTSRRKIEAGDFVFCELSAAWWDYSGQVLRGFTVEAEPTPLYRDLHATAAAAFASITKAIRPGVLPQALIDASGIVEENGFTTCDDLVHGYGGGYLPPIVGSKSRPSGQMPTFALQENMCLVVQPNVITRDLKAGVQFGELGRVTRDGFESLHRTPPGMFRAGQMI
jgi:Xaa-Pro dipeptidase